MTYPSATKNAIAGPYRIPHPVEDFPEMANGDRAPFLVSPELEYSADVLIGKYPELNALHEHDIRYMWRRGEKKKRGRAVLGYTYLHTEELQWLTDCEASIVLCGSEMKRLAMTGLQIEAVLYHELKHLGVTKNDKLGIRDHDVYMFYDEIRRYGLYLQDLQAVGSVVKQAELWPGAEKVTPIRPAVPELEAEAS